MNKVVQLFTRQRDSKQEFIRLVAPHIDLMYRMAFRWAGNQGDAEDLVQDVLIKLASRVSEMAAIEKLRPWLIKIVFRQFLDLYRKQSRSPLVLVSDLHPGETDDDSGESCLERIGGIEHLAESAPDHADQIARQQVVEQALASLSDEHRDVILLHDLEGYSAAEVAEILEISIGTVKSRLHRCREKLKIMLTDGTFSEPLACQEVKERVQE